MMTKAEARQRTKLLKRLRGEHQETVAATQALLKEQRKTANQICQAVRDKPKTVPEMAELIGLPSHEVLWHVAALKKYGILEEAGACGMYYLYQPTEEARK